VGNLFNWERRIERREQRTERRDKRMQDGRPWTKDFRY
jgi:hypothetical protein